MSKIRTLNFLPEIFQTPTNRQFLAATLDQLVNPPVNQTIQGYIGSRFGYGVNANDFYVPEPNKVRTNYQLDPGVVFTKENQSTAKDFISYPGIIDALREQGGITDNNDRLFNSQFYSWDSFVDLDKLINYNEYYWIPNGLPAIVIATSTIYSQENYTVTSTENTYQIGSTNTGAADNPVITLLRGGTYTFQVDQDTQFWIQGEPGITGYSLTNPNQYVRNIYGVTNNGATDGTVTFTVPQPDVQNEYEFIGNNQIDLATNLLFSQVNGQLLSSLGDIDGVTDLENLTLMFYNGTPQTTYYTITYTGSSSNPTITLVAGLGIPVNEKITVQLGNNYGGLDFYRNSIGLIAEIPYFSAPLDTLYYQDGTSPTKVGVIKLVENNILDVIDVEADILGKLTYTSPNGVQFTNGMKITFQGNVFPASYRNTEYYVEGVGKSIELIAVNSLICPEDFTVSRIEPFDISPYDMTNYDASFFIPEQKDYITIARSSINKNAWARSNRWFHIDVINSTASYNNDPDIALEYATKENKAIRPIIEFYPNLKLFNLGTESKGFVDFLDTRTTDALTQVADQVCYYPDVQVYTGYDAIIAGVTSGTTTTITVPASSVNGTFQVNQYISDSLGLLPLDAQITSIVGTTNLIITVQWSAVKTFGTTTNISLVANDISNSNFGLFDGAKIIFANDNDPSVRSKIYVANFSIIAPSTPPVITLTEALNGDVFVDDQVIILRGYIAQGKTYYYNGIYEAGITIPYVQAQQKVTVNQPPLFDVFDENGISFGDQTVYKSSSFIGNKLFAYGIGTGPDDPILDFPIRYSSITNIGDISFDVSLNKDTFNYVEGFTPVTKNVNTGYVYNYSTRTDFTRELGWKTAIGESVQYQIFEFDYDPLVPPTSYTCDVAALDSTESPWPTVFLYVNNQIVEKTAYTVTKTSNSTTINYSFVSPIATKVQVLLLSNQVSNTAYYGIPINLNNNPFNGEIVEVNTGDIRGHFQSIFYNNPNSTGNVFGSNNYRDLGVTVPYGTRIIQNSASLALTGTFLRKKNNYLFDAILFNSREYIKYKSLLVATVNSISFDQTFTPSNVLDAAIDQITAAKSQEQPFFWSDMLPAKAPIISNSYTINNFLTQGIFPTTQQYDFNSANYSGVLVYVTRTGTDPLSPPFTWTQQLIKGIDYTVSQDNRSITVTFDLQLGDIVTVKEYTQTYGSYVPNTPTKLGLYPSFIPEVVYDTTFITPTWFIRGHDGSYNKLYGDYDPVKGILFDFRDQALFEFETRIYNNLKLSSTIPIQEYEILPGFFRTTDYSYDEILQIYTSTFLNWVGENRINYQTQLYNTNNEFTYNYNDSGTKIDKQVLNIGSWRGIYEYFYDTAIPNSNPWEMLGYENKPTWWETRYGAAPYTSDNLVLWTDLENGIDWNNGNPIVIPHAVRPGLTSVIPVDESGVLLSPLRTVVGNFNPNIFQRDWKVGDVGPAEYSYRRSSSYPFDLMRILALTKPAKFFNLGVDLDNYKYNTEFNQYLVNNRSHLVPANIQIYGSGTAKTSYINWIVDYEKQAGVDATTNISTTLNNLDVRLVYRLAGYSDKMMLKFFVEKGSANDVNSSLLIPDESYSVLLYENQPYDRIIYSPVIVQITSEGFTVFGNSQVTAYFTTLAPKINNNLSNITVENLRVKIANDYTTEEVIIPYGTTFYSVQEVSQFLMSYGKYLESKGMLFTDLTDSIPVNWELMVKEFLYWTQFGWENGNVITLNPAAITLVIDKENTIVQPLTIQDSNFVLNQNLYPIKSSDLSVVRDGTYFSVTPLNRLDTVAYGQFNLSNFEHGIVFDNVTVFDDVIYNLITGLRQTRIFVRGTKSAEWNGTITASGFIYNQDNITEWDREYKYTKGSIVTYKNKYWTALTIVQPGNTFNEKEWKITDYNEIQKGLLPNSSTRSYESALYYDIYKTNLENDANVLAFSLIGYRPRDYLAIADLTDITQINVYKNMIKSKGTLNSLSAFKGAQLPQGGIEYDVYENWAIKTGEFGGVLNNNFVDFKLNQNLLTGNPSTVGLVKDVFTNGVQQEVPLTSLYNYSRPISSPDILPVQTDYPPSNLYQSAGFVNFNDVKMSSFFYSQAASAVDANGLPVSINDLYVRDYYWVANFKNQWAVLTPQSIGQVILVTSNLNGTATITFEEDHGLAKYDAFAIINFNDSVNGYYLVDTIVNSKQVLVNLLVNTNSRQITGNGIAYRFSNQRVESPAAISMLPLLDSEFVKNTVWVDTDVAGDWAVYRKSLNYKNQTQLSITNSSAYGSAVAYSQDVGYVITDPNVGKLYRYAINLLNGQWEVEQTITNSVSFGTSVVHKNNIYVVTEPTGTPKVHIYIQNPTVLNTNLVPYQAPIQQRAGSVEWGSKVALSGDTNWLYISDAIGQKIYVYRKQSFEVSSGYFVVGETYVITSLGNTNFVALGAVENKVGITFIATSSGISTDTGTATQVTYKFSTEIDGTALGQEFGSSLATDYYGDTLVVGSPGFDYNATASNSGIAYAYNRTVQNIEVQTTSTVFDSVNNINIPQIFNLGWTPTPTTFVTADETTTLNGLRCSIGMGIFNVNDPVMFTSAGGAGFGTSNISPYVVYYIGQIGANYIQLKRDLSSTTFIDVGNSTVYLNVYVQATPLYVSVNGTLVQPNNYAAIGNQLHYAGYLNAGDVVNVSDNQFTLIQTLQSPDTPRNGVQYGRGLDVTKQATEILVGAPYSLVETTNQEGSVYRWTNAGGKFGIVTGIDGVGVSGTKNLFINGYLVTLDASGYGGTMNADQVASVINSLAITNIEASANNNVLTIKVINDSIAQVNEKIVLATTSPILFGELGIQLYTQTQVIRCPHEVGPTQFGKTIKFNEYDSVIIGAPVGTRYTATTFDFTDDENFTNDTLFDNNTTQFIDSYANAGAVYMFDYLGTFNENLNNLGQFTYAQSLNSTDQIYGSKPLYGEAIDFSDWSVIVGSPEYRIDSTTGCEITLGSGGQVTTFDNSVGEKDWSVYRTSSLVVDIEGIENVQIYSAETNNTLINLDYIDPLQNKILGAVRENINVVSNTDPAGYNTGINVNKGLVWGAEHVGSMWFDTTNVRFVNYHQDDVNYNTKYWAALFPGSDVAVYTWIASTVPPSAYQGPGTPFDTATYTVQASINASNSVVPTYYFWARNTGVIFTKAGKTLADSVIESYIRNPKNSGIAYMAPLLPNVFALYNTQQYVNANDSVLHIGYKTGTNDDVSHSEYNLIRANYAEDFLPGIPSITTTDHLRAVHGTATYTSAPPESLYDRLLDSMAGLDETGAVVPNPLLPKAAQSGVLVRPRQSFFYSRLGAIKNYLQYANEILAQYPITETRPGTTFLFNKNPIIYNKTIDSVNMVAGTQYIIVSTGTTDYTQFGAGSNTIGTAFIATGPATGTGTVDVVVGNAIYQAGTFVIGSRYQIETLGNTDFTLIGASANEIGEIFIATGVGTGTGTAQQVLFLEGEAYDTSQYWSYINWWAPGYNDSTKAALQVPIYASLSTLTVTNGTIVSVLANGDGKTEFYVYESDTDNWTRIGLVNGTIKFKEILWNYTLGYFGWGDNFFDNSPYDSFPSEETRYIIRALNEQIYTNELLIHRNKSLILLFEYIQSETVESQNLLPWLNKTSLVDVAHTIRELEPIEVYRSDNQVFLSGYLNEVKPYHVLIKEFLLKYTGTEVYPGNLTDFDLPSQYNKNVNQYISPVIEYDNVNAVNEFLPNDDIWSEREYSQWRTNYGLSFTGVNDYNISYLVSYMDLATNSIIVDNVWGFPINGTITIGTEQIFYNNVDRDAGILFNLQRGVNDTTISEHLPNEPIFMNLPPVILLDSGRGYINPPRITAYINTSLYPAPTVEAVFEPVMSLDKVLSINVVEPGQGYVVQPEIVIEPATSAVFTSIDVDVNSNTIRLFAPYLRTGDIVQYKVGTGTPITGLTENQWYYIAVLEEIPVYVVGFYSSYTDAITDHDRIELYSAGTGSHILNEGARAIPIIQSTPIRENITTLRFDRTTYTSQVTDWSANTLYAGPFIGDYYTSQEFSSSTLKLYSSQPAIQSIPASSQGFVLQISDVTNDAQTYWSTFTRFLDRTFSTVGTESFVARLYVPGGTLTNTSGSTIGFTVDMPIKFIPVEISDADFYTRSNILANTTYYVAQVINETDFKIKDSTGTIVELDTWNFANTAVTIYTAQVVDTAILTVNYPGIRTATATTNYVTYEGQKVFGTITIPRSEVWTGGNEGMYTNLPVYFDGNTFGGVIKNQAYYVTSIVGSEEFTISESQNPTQTAVTATTTGTNIITVDDTTGFNAGTPVVFSGDEGFGNIELNKIYFVTVQVSGTELAISEQLNGANVALTTDTGNIIVTSQANTTGIIPSTGSMTVNLALPISPAQINGQKFTLYETSNNYPNITTFTIANYASSNATATLTSVDRIILDDITDFYVNMPFEISDPVGGIFPATTYFITDLGQVSANVTGSQAIGNLVICNATDSLYAGMPVVFTGEGFGNIVISQQYYVESITSFTEFSISETAGGPQVSLPSMSGNCVVNGLYYAVPSSSLGGPAEPLATQIAPFTVTQKPTVQPEFSVSWILGGYRVIIVDGGEGFAVDNTLVIPGALVGGSTPQNNVTLSVNATGNVGDITGVIIDGTVPVPSNDYYLKAISSNQLALYSDPLMTDPVSGLTLPYIGFTDSGVSNVAATTITITNTSDFTVNDAVVFTGTMDSDIVEGYTYFIVSLDNITGNVEISELPGGNVFATNGSGNSVITMSKVGSYAFLPEPFYFDQSLVKYNNRVYGCVISNSDPDFVYGKWELLQSDDRRLNALDRIIGYYQPTDNMPGIDLTQLVANIVYPNSTYYGNPFEPSEQWILDTTLISEPFVPEQVNLVAVTNNGTTYLAPANLPEYSAIAKDDVGTEWDLYRLSTTPLELTNILYDSGNYVITSTNGTTPILKSTDGNVWSVNAYYDPDSTLPWSNSTIGLDYINSANISLRSVAKSGNIWTAVGDGVILSSNDLNIWHETYTGNITLNEIFYNVTTVPNGFIAVGTALTPNAIGTLVTSGLIKYSPNGIVWYDTNLVTNKILYGAASSPSISVAVGLSGGIFTSIDGLTWIGSREIQVFSTIAGDEILNTGDTLYFNVDDQVRVNQSFAGLSNAVSYYVANVVSSNELILSPDPTVTNATAISAGRYQITSIGTTDFTLIGAASNTVGLIFNATGPTVGTGTARQVVPILVTSGAPDRTFLNKYPVPGTMVDVYYNGTRFVGVGNNGLIRTSNNGHTWVTQVSGTTEDLKGVTFAAGTWTVVGDNNTILQSTNNGVTWVEASTLIETPPIYNIQGDPFEFGYGPEELVPGNIDDTLTMIVITRPGTTWEATEYGHVGYRVVSLELQATSATDNKFSFANAVSIPAELSCFIINASTNLSTSIYETLDYTIDWVNQRVEFASTNPLGYVSPSNKGNTLRIDVYEVGNGNQLEKSSTKNDPIRVNNTTGFNEIYLNCNYSGPIWLGSGVIQPNSYPIEVNAYATDGLTNQIFLDSVEALTVNTPITFAGATFGNITEETVYYVKSLSQVTNSIVVSLTYNLSTGLAGPTVLLTTATGSMNCIISYGTGSVYTDPVVYHNGTKLVLGKTNTINRTKSFFNTIVCNSTGGLIVNTPIVFSNTIFGGIVSQTTYYIKQIVDANEFTISATLGGPTLVLSSATGSATFVTNDYAIGLAPNGVSAKMILAAQYDTLTDFISYTVFGETLPSQYGFTLPQTQTFIVSAGQTSFALNNFIANDWYDAAIVEVNGIRITPANYLIDPVGDNINFTPTDVPATSIIPGLTYVILTVGSTDFTAIGAASNTVGVQFVATGVGSGTGAATVILGAGDILAVTLFNDTQRQYFKTEYGLTGSAGSISGLVVGSTTHTDFSFDELANAGTFVSGQSYVINTIGTTDFTLIGAASNTPGLSFTATGAGSGTGTAYVAFDESAYDESTDFLSLISGTTASIAINDAVTFTAPTIGGIVAGTTYYVIAILNSTDFVISETIGGSPFEVYTDSGFMPFDVTPIRVNNIIAISNSVADPEAIVTVTNTTTGTNRITCSSTSGFVGGQTIIFKGTGFGGIQTDGTVYFIDTVVSSTQFTIKDENNVVITLSTAAGSMQADVGGQPAIRVTTGIPHNFSENSLIIIDGTLGSIQLNGNTYYAKIITSTVFDLYTEPYNPAISAINYPVLFCSTYLGGGYTWLSGLFRLRTTYATSSSSVTNRIDVTSAVKLVVNTPVYFTEPGIALGTPILGGLIAGQKYFIAEVIIATNQIAVSETWQGPIKALTTDTGTIFVTQWEQDNVDRLWVTVNGRRVPSSLLRLYPANEIGILETIGTGDVVVVTSMMPSPTPNEQVYLNFVNQANEGTVYRANSQTKTWITQNLDVLDTVIYVNDITRLTNIVTQTSITPAAVDGVYTVGLDANRQEIQSISIINLSQSIVADSLVVGQTYRIVSLGTTNFTTLGASENKVGVVFVATAVGTGTGTCNPYINESNYTQGIVDVAPVVFIDSGSWISAGDNLEIITTVGRVLFVNGEQIAIHAVDLTNNTITSFTRGANGTPIALVIPKYTEVYSILSANKMTNTLYRQTWNSYVFDPVQGDPLQISETQGAIFLNVDIT